MNLEDKVIEGRVKSKDGRDGKLVFTLEREGMLYLFEVASRYPCSLLIEPGTRLKIQLPKSHRGLNYSIKLSDILGVDEKEKKPEGRIITGRVKQVEYHCHAFTVKLYFVLDTDYGKKVFGMKYSTKANLLIKPGYQVSVQLDKKQDPNDVYCYIKLEDIINVGTDSRKKIRIQ